MYNSSSINLSLKASHAFLRLSTAYRAVTAPVTSYTVHTLYTCGLYMCIFVLFIHLQCEAVAFRELDHISSLL